MNNEIDQQTSDVIANILNKAPFTMKLMDVSKVIKQQNLKQITSNNIYAPNTKSFHPKGLFSEEIFGRITSLERFTTLAYITLNTRILHPEVFVALINKKRVYDDIMSGSKYAIFDKEKNDFVLADPEDKNADTGFSFFLKHIKHLSKNPIKSVRKKPINEILNKYKDQLLIKEFIVMPAGLRDIKMDAGRLSQDDVNKKYLSLLNLSMSLSEYALSEDKIFDSIRYSIQKKANEIFSYIFNILEGKKGFLQGHYTKRKIVFGTRNVASAATMKSNTPDDPTNILVDETKLPMLSVMKELQPLMVNFIKNIVYREVFGQGSTTTVQAIDPETLEVKYITVSPKEVKKRTTSKGIEGLINKFKQIRFREKSLAVFDKEGKEYWITLAYDLGNKIYTFKNLEELKMMMNNENDNTPIDKKLIRPMTWAETIYIGCVVISKNKHAFITRYPAIEDGSIFPSKIHVLTTTPDRKVKLISPINSVILPHYPILGNKYHDSLIVHPARLGGLGMDFDGDTGSINAIMSDDSNEEIKKYMNNPSSIIDDNMNLKISGDSGITSLIVYNLSK